MGHGAPLSAVGVRVRRPRPRARSGRARAAPRRSAASRAPVRFVNSLGLGDPPVFGTVGRRLECYPRPALQARRAGVVVARRWSPRSPPPAPSTSSTSRAATGSRSRTSRRCWRCTRASSTGSPTRSSRTRTTGPEVAALLEPHAARVSFDAPIATVADIAATPFGARIVNVKPSRIGRVRALLDVYEHCEHDGVRMYGGGMGELGVARGQIELLAALFHPDGPNDVAPSAYNLPDLPPGLPESPLTPPPGVTASAGRRRPVLRAPHRQLFSEMTKPPINTGVPVERRTRLELATLSAHVCSSPGATFRPTARSAVEATHADSGTCPAMKLSQSRAESLIGPQPRFRIRDWRRYQLHKTNTNRCTGI